MFKLIKELIDYFVMRWESSPPLGRSGRRARRLPSVEKILDTLTGLAALAAGWGLINDPDALVNAAGQLAAAGDGLAAALAALWVAIQAFRKVALRHRIDGRGR